MFYPEVKSTIREDISILLKLDNHPWNYICECGDASNLTVREVQNTNAIFISHTHIDHFINFDTIIRHQIGIQRRVTICGPKNIAKQVQARIKSYTWNLIKKGAIIYEIREVLSNQEIKIYELEPPVWELKEIRTIKDSIIFKEKHFTVNYTILDHKTPSIAYKFKENDLVKIDLKESDFKGGTWVKELKNAFKNQMDDQIITVEDKKVKAKELFHLLHLKKGDTIGIIMDHLACKQNHDKIRSHFFMCRKVFIECFYKNEDRQQAEINFHSYADMSGKIMQETEVKEAIPVHFSRKYNEYEINELILEFESALKK
ncbi:ribonuclease Z [Aquimarina addita]|uniref:Ribonuclease Z n=1 Tax=Aquimarina addita TaxID=870485 RepID=A0ABP6UTF2_9FLAO